MTGIGGEKILAWFASWAVIFLFAIAAGCGTSDGSDKTDGGLPDGGEVVEGPPLVFWVFDQGQKVIFRLVDTDEDGFFHGEDELQRFFDGDVSVTGIKNSQGLLAMGPHSILATDNIAPANIVWLQDADLDGSAYGEGESWVFFDGQLPMGYSMDNPTALVKGPDGAFYFIDSNTLNASNPEAIYRLKDKDADGVASFPDEIRIFHELAPPGDAYVAVTFRLVFNAVGDAFVFDIHGEDSVTGVYRIDALGNERTPYFTNGMLSSYNSFMYLDSGATELGVIPSTQEIVVPAFFFNLNGSPYLMFLAVKDKDDSGAIDADDEIRVLYDAKSHPAGITHGYVSDLWVGPDDSVFWVERGISNIVKILDLNGDGDVEDEGELVHLFDPALSESTEILERPLSMAVHMAPCLESDEVCP